MRAKIALWPGLFVLCLLTGPVRAGEPVAVSVAVSDAGLGGATLVVARDGQHFSQAGLAVRLAPATSDTMAEQAVAQGGAEFGAAPLSAGLLAYAAAHDLRIVAPEYSDQTGYASTVLVVAPSVGAGPRGLASLAHRRIGLLSLESAARFALVGAAARYGVPAGALTLVQVGDEAQLQRGLASGALDAAVVPDLRALAWRPALHGFRVIRLSDFVQWQDGVIFTRADTLRGKPERAAAFLRAYRAGAADYALTFQQRDDEGTALPGPHFGAYLAAIAAAAGVKPADAAYALPYCDRLARLDMADLGRQLAFWQALGLVGRDVTVAGIADDSLNPAHFGDAR